MHILKLPKSDISKITNIWIFNICLCTLCMLLHTVCVITCGLSITNQSKSYNIYVRVYSVPYIRQMSENQFHHWTGPMFYKIASQKFPSKFRYHYICMHIYISKQSQNPNDYMQLSWKKEIN